ENLKLPSEDLVIPEESASSTGTLSSLQNLEKELSFTDQFFVKKHQEEEPGKTNVSKAVDEIITDAVDWAMQAPLQTRFSDLPAVDMKEILQQWIFEDKSYEDHKKLYDALEKSLERDYSDQLLSDLEEARQKKRKRRDVPRTPFESPPPQPPPLPPLAGASGAPGTLGASGSSQLPPPPPPPSTAPQSMASTTSDTRYESAGLSGTQELSPTDSLIPDDSILDEQERQATPEPTWTIHSSNVSDVEKIWAIALASTYVTPAENSLLAKTGDMTNFLNWYCRQKDLEYLRHGSKKSSHALSISNMKAASYPDFRLELLVLEQMWIEDVCTYDISAKYDYLSEIVLRRADLQEHTITEKDFKNLHPIDFEDLNMLLLQGYEFKHDYTIIESPRAVVFPVNNNERKIMRFNEIYKFSDGTLTRILEALAYRVKEFKIKQLNPGINMRFWTQKDMTRRKEFIAAIERRLKTRRIYRNLKCFVGGRVRDIDYRLLQRTK
nr:hypothetical protein [Tanacetum cinerariifolium]